MNALELADYMENTERWNVAGVQMQDCAEMLRRQHEAIRVLRGALVDCKYGLEGARIWGGMEWTYNPLHAYKYLPLRDKAEQALQETSEFSK